MLCLGVFECPLQALDVLFNCHRGWVQACLFKVLQSTESRDTRSFWKYKEYFQRECRTDADTFTAECSDQARPTFRTTHRADALAVPTRAVTATACFRGPFVE